MAQEPNRLLRIIVPLALLASGVAYFIYVAIRPPVTPPGQTPPAATTAANPPTAAPKAVDERAGEKKADGASSETPQNADQQTAQTSPASPPTPPAATVSTTYSASTYPLAPYQPIGSTTPKDKGGTFEMELRFSAFGAGVDRLSLANHFTTIQHTESEVVQQFRALPQGLVSDARAGTCGFAMNKVEVNGKVLELGLTPDPNQTFWKQTARTDASATFEAEILDGDGKPAVRITRTYTLPAASFEVTLEQKARNLTGAPLKIVWHQFGPTTLPAGTIRYGGDVRRVRFGYIWPPAKDGNRTVVADDRGASLIPYPTALGEPNGSFPGTILPRWDATTLWPNPDSTKNELTLAWAGISSRYFTVAMFPRGSGAISSPGRGADKAFGVAARIDRLAIPTGHVPTSGITGFLVGHPHLPTGEMVLRLTTPEMTIEPGQSADVSLGVYAGPSHKELIEQQPGAKWAGIPQVVLFTFGGPCGFCTFQGIAGLLRGLMNFLHDHVVFDWALAIMLLVVCVRTVLHPITRWSQKSLYKFGKEMSKLGPKQKAIQEKYKDDPTKMREEMGRLMKEEGISYTGALGCIPAFLQTPVWIGLSAMIYFAFDLRHQHAFFGVFQSMTGHKWGFLGDLAEPDQLIPFGTSFNVPLISSFMGSIDGLNILPLLLGVVFYVQQKYLTPPSTTPLTPEQQQQQKMIKIMTVVLFPLMMYNAPAGLALYFATNSALAIIESKWIRAKAEEEYKEAELIAAAKTAAGIKPSSRLLDRGGRDLPQKEGFLARLRRMADEAQKTRAQQAKGKGKGKKK